MGLFKKEVVVIKESSKSKEYLDKLEQLYSAAPAEVQPAIEKEIKLTKYGIAGEDNILFELRHSDMDMVVLQDLYMKSGDTAAQIDFFVITPKINFLIECKNLYGNIEINNNGDFIRSYELRGRKIKEGIYSPITQNERHLTVLKRILMDEAGIVKKASLSMWFDTFYKSLVVLANPKTVLNDRYARKEIKEKVIRADQLITVIKDMNSSSKEMKSSMKEMISIGQRMISRCSAYDGFADRYEKLRQKVEDANHKLEEQSGEKKPGPGQEENSSEGLICPRCGAPLVLRTAKKGDNAGKQFYGCSSFPKCRYIQNV